ncbi:MAG TPA: ATP-binding protein [Gemmataceae bacterium]|nr:ATP-binding protein [Gemmataceae bacterium]
MGMGEAAFRALADATDDCVFLTDRKGRYLAVNRGFARWVGRSEDEILGRTGSDLWPSGFLESQPPGHLLALKGERVEREELRPRGGETRTVRTVRTPVRDEGGAVCGVLGVFRDVSDEEAQEDARQRSVQLELVGQLAGGVAHDFNNLLTAVLGHVALLRDMAPPAGPYQELLAAVEKAASQASALSQQILAFLRKQNSVPEPVDLNAVAAQMTDLLRWTIDRRIRIELRLQPALPLVNAVAAQLGQLLLNLCLNARDAMPHGGRMQVETCVEIVDADRARLHPLRRAGRFVRLRVADNGEGMPPAVRARLFEPAFTTKPPGQGNGFGLAIVQQVVQGHQGWIECISSVGEGTCFDVYLPIRVPDRDAAD